MRRRTLRNTSCIKSSAPAGSCPTRRHRGRTTALTRPNSSSWVHSSPAPSADLRRNPTSCRGTEQLSLLTDCLSNGAIFHREVQTMCSLSRSRASLFPLHIAEFDSEWAPNSCTDGTAYPNDNCGTQSQSLLVRGRPIDMIDHQDGHGSLGGRQFQPELVDRLEQRQAAGGRGRGRHRPPSAGAPAESRAPQATCGGW